MESNEPPRLTRQITSAPMGPIFTTLPAVSWADMVEDDPDLALMGPPPLPPGIVSAEQFEDWLKPRRYSRAQAALLPPEELVTENPYTILFKESVPEEWEPRGPAPSDEPSQLEQGLCRQWSAPLSASCQPGAESSRLTSIRID